MAQGKKEPLEVRFWQHVNKRGPYPPGKRHLGRCWMWTAAVHPNGYGACSVGNRTPGAHRVSLFLKLGRWPEQWALHRCDVCLCVRPDHLYEGTPKDNAADRDKTDNHTRGENNGRATLTDELVRKIRAEHIPRRVGPIRLARRYGLSAGAVSQALYGSTWKHVE